MIGHKEKEIFIMALEKHSVEEAKILAEYRNLATKLKNGTAGLLIYLILSDEDHHHRLLRELAQRLKGTAAEEPMTIESETQKEALDLIHQLERHEEETIEDCRRLKTQVATGETELFDAIMDAFISDSQKHHRLLLALEETMKA